MSAARFRSVSIAPTCRAGPGVAAEARPCAAVRRLAEARGGLRQSESARGAAVRSAAGAAGAGGLSPLGRGLRLRRSPPLGGGVEPHAASLGPRDARGIVDRLAQFVGIVRDWSVCPIACFPGGCRHICRQECFALAMVAASQNQDLDCLAAAMRHLLDPEGHEEAMLPALAYAEAMKEQRPPADAGAENGDRGDRRPAAASEAALRMLVPAEAPTRNSIKPIHRPWGSRDATDSTFLSFTAALAPDAAAAWSPRRAPRPMPSAVIDNYGDIAQAMYEDALTTAKTLHAAVDAFLADPTEENAGRPPRTPGRRRACPTADGGLSLRQRHRRRLGGQGELLAARRGADRLCRHRHLRRGERREPALHRQRHRQSEAQDRPRRHRCDARSRRRCWKGCRRRRAWRRTSPPATTPSSSCSGGRICTAPAPAPASARRATTTCQTARTAIATAAASYLKAATRSARLRP